MIRSGFFARAKNPGGVEPPGVELVEEHRLQDREAVPHGGAEGDLRGLVEVARLDRNLPDREAAGHSLRDDLRVEHETVGVLLEVDRLEVAAAVGPESAEVLGLIDQESRVRDPRACNVAYELQVRH